MDYKAIGFTHKLSLINDQWAPKVVEEMNNYQFELVKRQGDLVWHDHKDTDETFIVLEGLLRIDLRDGAIQISAGEMFVKYKHGSRICRPGVKRSSIIATDSHSP